MRVSSADMLTDDSYALRVLLEADWFLDPEMTDLCDKLRIEKGWKFSQVNQPINQPVDQPFN